MEEENRVSARRSRLCRAPPARATAGGQRCGAVAFLASRWGAVYGEHGLEAFEGKESGGNLMENVGGK